MIFKQVNFLFGEGIREKAVQRELIEIYPNKIKSSVLYVPKVSGFYTGDFISAVSPRILVVNEAYSKQIGLLTKTALFHTEAQGTIKVLTDGEMLRVRTYIGEKESMH